ncbi:YDG domain-containing protein [Acinetobacter sp. ANC 3832]|uniref:YDG domain-containing protein n=1 Tax=Acinetobacter sp. ANC 3832 TaxID=1977874 RepID=UPI000A348B80|nr:YDG domain-containing protein [Acinetobacter sp. ANC 3832]OTG89239.1 hypothetical protein B9T35_16740 [Acinetobacter sp. ANC 3832]
MNKVYKTVWNKRQNCSQVTSEQSKGQSKNSQSSSQVKAVEIQKNWFDFARLSLLSLALLPLSIWAGIYDTQLPTGGNVTVGSAQISQNNNTLNVHQNSQNVGIQWNDFNIGQNATVNFHQPNSSSIAVNRVLDSNASQIMGKLNANGQVFLLNPNGVIFSKTAQVNVGGIVASTLNVTDGDIMSGNFTLKNQGGAGKVENHGSIIADGGVIAFIAPNVINTGNVESKNGVIHFTAADQVTLHLQDGQLTEYQVDIGTLQGLIDNQGAILANNGAVYLTAKAKDSLSKAVVNHSGIIEANRLTKNAKGEIVLLADMEQGTANINGVLKAEGKNGQDGGFIETSASTVHIGQDTQVSTKAEGAKTGTWLIDPTDFTIHGGTGAATGSGIGAITLQNNLNNTSVQLETQNTGSEKGDIHVNAAVTWNKDTKLTLKAHNDININANITAQHQDGKVELLYGQNGEKNANYYLNNNAQINLHAGQNFSIQKGTDTVNRIDYTVITQLGNEGSTSGTDLQGINGDLSGNYVLGADIDATITKDWGSFDEQGFNPIGNEWDGSFTGRFDGLGHKVSNLNIDRSYAYGVGLFGSIQDAIVRNVGVQSGSIRGDSFVGGLVGQSHNSLIENSFSRANVEGIATIGGLVGGNYDGSQIQDSYATGNVTGGDFSLYAGGLAGANDNAQIENSYATGTVKGDEIVGGLVGDNNNNAVIDRSYATGQVTGGSNVGGLAGNSYYGSEIKDSYAVGSVTGNNIVGGLVGENLAASINTSYALGKVTATDQTEGGLVAKNTQGTVNNSYWDKDRTGQTTSAGSANKNGLASQDMFKADQFIGFDFDTVWGNANDQTTPYLQNHNGSNQVIKKDDITGAFYGVIQTIQQLQAVNNQLDGHYLIGNDIDASATQSWGDSEGNGFKSIGDQDSAFTGVIDGLGHQIKELYIDRKNSDQVGLIGINQGTVNHLSIKDANITGRDFVGGVIGQNEGQVSEIYSSGTIAGQKHVGGLLGSNNQTVHEVYSTANVSGQQQVGGLVGQNTGTLQDIYSTGDVTGVDQVGGLVGFNSQNANIKNAFTTGTVTGASKVGGVVGQNDGTLIATYWNIDHQQTTSKGVGEGLGDAIGLNTEQMKYAKNFSFLNEDSQLGGKDTIWRIYEGNTGPLLRHYLTTVDLSLKDKNTTYDGKKQHFADVWGLDESKYKAQGQVSGTNAGEYKANYYSDDQQGYDFIGNEGTLTINKAKVTVTGSSETDKIYNGQNQSMNTPTYTVDGMVKGESETLLGNILVSGETKKDAGTYDNKVTGENQSTQNYDIVYVDGKFIINKKKITVTALDETREYNGFNQQVTSFKAEGLVDGENESVLANSVNALATRKDAGVYDHAVGYRNNDGDKNYDIEFKWGKYTITKANVIVKGDNLNTIYNGTVQNQGGYVVSGLKGNDKQGVLGNIGNTAASGKNAGQYQNAVSGAESSANYNIVYENGVLDIAKKQITGSISAQDKVYDGTTNAIVNGSLSGVINGDNVNITAQGQFSDKNAGSNKNVNVSGALNGTDAGNYALSTNLQTQANISKKQITGSITAQDKVYDGTTNAIVNGSLNGVISGDNVNISAQGQFVDKNAGSNKNVNVSGALNGTDAGNYALSTNVQTQANISKKQITGSITAQDKIYDGTTNAIVNGSLNGVISGDNVNITAQGQFVDKNAGSNKNVNVSGALNGTDAGNYALLTNVQTQANISKKQISGSITAQDKVYDGTSNAIVNGSLNGVISGDNVNITAQGQFSDKNAGSNKNVNVSGALNGTDAGNYDLSTNLQTQANISKKQISGVLTAQNKVYDGTANAIVNGSLNGVISGDQVDLTAQGQFTDKNAGSNKNVNVSGVLNGTDAGNYDLSTNLQTQANISKKQISGVLTAQDKVYDGSTNAIVNGSLDQAGIIVGDQVAVGGTGHFVDKNAGQNKEVNVSSSLIGTDAGNYELTTNDQVTANISKKQISGVLTAQDKVYDGTTNAIVDGSLNGVISGDNVNITAQGQFTDKNAGSNKNVNVSGDLNGTDAGNYELSTNLQTQANISKKQISGSINAQDKVYDGITNAIVGGSLNGVIDGDQVDLTAQGQFIDKNAGSNKNVNVSGALNGTDAGNYDLSTNLQTQANISKKQISGVLTAQDKVYDGTTNAIVNGHLDQAGIIAGDQVAVGGTGHFVDKNAGQNKAVNASSSLIGTDAGNYELTTNGQVTANIAKKQITGSISAQDKVYDGTTNAIVGGSLNGVIDGDNVNISAQGQFSDKNAGLNKNVNVSGALNGTDAGNYALSTNLQTQANISKKQITGSITAQDKVYDGTTNAIVNGSLNGVISGDNVNITAQGQFTDKNAGSNKNVNVSGVLNGTDAGNYDLSTNLQTQANISKKQISGSISAQDKVYDGTTNAIVNGSLNGVISGDNVNITAQGQFTDKNAGSNKNVDVSGALNGTDAGNYELSTNLQTQADIAKAKAHVIGNNLTATYSGQQQHVSGFTVNGLVGGETASVLTGITATGANGTKVGTYANDVSGSDQNYDLSFTAGMLKITDTLVIPVPPIPEKPTVPDIPALQGFDLQAYQRAIQFAPQERQPKQSNQIEIEIMGDGINMDGIQTLTGKF